MRANRVILAELVAVRYWPKADVKTYPDSSKNKGLLSSKVVAYVLKTYTNYKINKCSESCGLSIKNRGFCAANSAEIVRFFA